MDKGRDDVMITGIVYYSLDGNTKFAAEQAAKYASGLVTELKIQKPYPAKGFRKMFVCGKDAMFKKTPELQPYKVKKGAELIIVATPIWAGHIAAPVRTFLTENDFSGKKLALLTTSMSGSADKTEADVKQLQPNAQIISVLSINSKKAQSEIAEQISQWAKTLS